MRIKSKYLIEKGRLGASWLAARQTSEGIYQSLKGMNADGIYPDTDDVCCYYKGPRGLSANGETLASVRALSYVVRRFMTTEGDFITSPEKRAGGSYTVRYCNLYPNGWLMWAASSLGYYKLARKILDFMLTCSDSQTGGFRSLIGNQSSIVDSNSTAISILACLLGGEIKRAIVAGDFLIRMIETQPDPRKYYIRWMPGESHITEYAKKETKYYVINAPEPAQFYWQVGLAMCMLAKLYEFTGEERFLKGAIRYYDFLISCHPDVTCTPPVGKLGWGSSILYRLTKDSRYLKTAQAVMEFILSCQQKEGWILQPPNTCLEDSIRNALDTTAEYITWMINVATELGWEGNRL